MVRILLECILVFINYIGCSDPDPVPNAQRFPEHGPYERLSFVTYTCNIGHTLIGSASITCHSHGQWSSPSPTCTPTGKDFNMLHYRPQTKFAKVMFSQVFVCPQGGVCLWSRGREDTNWADTRLGRHPPPGRQLRSGRYSSHWNAFLFLFSAVSVSLFY